jgi:hypothetical protein
VLEALITSVPKRVMRSYTDLSDYLEKRNIARQKLDEILLKLTEDRLLRANETDLGINYELVHDYLLEEIQIDPEVKKHKQTEELLEQAFQNWRTSEILIGKDTLKIIEGQLPDLILDQERVRFLIYSAAQVKDRKQLKVWKQLVQPETKAKIFADWRKNLLSRDSEKRQTAEKVLTPFWKDLFFPVGLYLISKRVLIENKTKFLASVIGLVILAVMVWFSMDSTVKWDAWKSITGYSAQCPGSATAPAHRLSSDFIDSQNIAVWNGGQNSICVSTDNGTNWFNLAIPDNARAVRKIQIMDNFVFMLFENGLVYTSITDKASPWTKVNLPDGAPGEVLFAAHPKNPGELWLTNGDGLLYHSTNWGGKWEKISKLPTTNPITAMETSGASLVIAAGTELWMQKETPGQFLSVQPKIPLTAEVTSINSYSPNVYYLFVDQQGIFILNVDNMFVGQGDNLKNLEVEAVTASGKNVIISNRQGIQCLKHIIPFRIFGLAHWSIITTPDCR